MDRQRPNILIILTDDQQFDAVGALGNAQIRTPEIDRLVAEGVAFTRASYWEYEETAPRAEEAFDAGRELAGLGSVLHQLLICEIDYEIKVFPGDEDPSAVVRERELDAVRAPDGQHHLARLANGQPRVLEAAL